jgi:hypothetical protein
MHMLKGRRILEFFKLVTLLSLVLLIGLIAMWAFGSYVTFNDGFQAFIERTIQDFLWGNAILNGLMLLAAVILSYLDGRFLWGIIIQSILQFVLVFVLGIVHDFIERLITQGIFIS